MITVAHALQSARETKERLGWEDLDPMVHVFTPEGEPDVLATLIVGPGQASAGIALILSEVKAVEAAMVIADVFVQKGGQPPVKAGDFQRRWQAGDREGLSEALSVMLARKDGSTETANQLYDAETKTWSEVTPGISRGQMLDALLTGVLKPRRN